MKHKVLGIAFICLLMTGVWFTHAIFSKKFVDYDTVSLETSKIGLQLPARADIKLRGVIVGEVLGFQATGDGAVVELGIYPDHIESIPGNVTGLIEPKTLFGEKFVSLQIPDAASSTPLRAGDRIEHTAIATEVEQVLSDLYPLLTTVQPADINRTLTAIATALEGRGERIGGNIEVLDSYLRRVNPQIPDVVEDLRLMAEVSDVYADVLPQLARILRNTVTTTGTFEEREAKVKKLFEDVAAFADTANEFLEVNGDNMVRLGEVSAAQLRVFAKYAPEYPCLLAGIVRAGKLQAEAFRGFVLHINLETLPNQPRGYNVNDLHVNGDKRGPHCGSLPNPPWSQSNVWTDVPNIDDGVEQPTGKGTRRVAPYFGIANAADAHGYVGTPIEAEIMRTILGPALGLASSDVSDLGVLLFAPMARGSEVSVR